MRLPIDMACLNPTLVYRIAEKVPLEYLDNLMDRRDKLQSKLFECKLSQMLKLV